MNKTCPQCSKTFSRRDLTTPGAFKGQIYCGMACYRAAQIPTVESSLARMEKCIDRSSPSGCWIWTGYTVKGYGFCSFGGRRMVAAHRVMYEVHKGPIPKGLFVCHTCDEPRCVNPAHMFLGDDQANTDDKVAKGRHNYGERNNFASLTEKDVLAIRAAYWCKGRKSNIRELEAKYPQVTHTAIYSAATGRSWKYLK